jgi:hypothetical protein
VVTVIPFVLQIMNMSGWILEIGSSIFRQVGTIRDSMETIAQPLTMLDKPGQRPLRWKGIVFDDVTFNYWRGKSGTVIRLQSRHRAGREGRSGGPVRRRQVDAGQPCLASVRRRGRGDPHRRAGRPRGDAGAYAGDQAGQPGYLAAASVDP